VPNRPAAGASSLRRALSRAGGLRRDEVEALSRRVIEMQQLILLVQLSFEARCSDYARDILRNRPCSVRASC
jgi:hypothetical protein